MFCLDMGIDARSSRTIPMKLHILSDLHIEFEAFNPPETSADIIVLAGDIHVGKKGIDWANKNFPDKPVFYILGNHEYYGQAWPKHVETLKQLAQGSNIHILENQSLTVNEVVFLGCTLWTDFKLFGDPRIAGYEATQTMTDYKKIRVSPSYRKLRSIDTATIHNKSLNWLGEEFIKNKGKKIVAISHHAPSLQSIPEKYKNDILTAAYVSNLDRFVQESGAALWIHGHIHAQCDYRIGSTRVICNPRGYPHEYNYNFVPDFTVEL